MCHRVSHCPPISDGFLVLNCCILSVVGWPNLSYIYWGWFCGLWVSYPPKYILSRIRRSEAFRLRLVAGGCGCWTQNCNMLTCHFPTTKQGILPPVAYVPSVLSQLALLFESWSNTGIRQLLSSLVEQHIHFDWAFRSSTQTSNGSENSSTMIRRVSAGCWYWQWNNHMRLTWRLELCKSSGDKFQKTLANKQA